jgi:hypothetical protein
MARRRIQAHAAAIEMSPDKQIRVEFHFKDRGNDALLYQFWTFDGNHRHGFLLNPGEGDDVADYAAGFRFSLDSEWIVLMQKLGAGYTLYLYRCNGPGFSLATKKPLDELAWNYFLNQPTARRCTAGPGTAIRSPICARRRMTHEKSNIRAVAAKRQRWRDLQCPPFISTGQIVPLHKFC